MKTFHEGPLGEEDKRIVQGEATANDARSYATSGEVFPDGSVVELLGGNGDGKPHLLLWDGANETTGPIIEHSGMKYEPMQLSESILHELILPMRRCPHGTTRELLAEICKLLEDFAGLPTKPASLVARFILLSWILEAVQIAPMLVLFGPDVARANCLVALLRRLCRHSLLLTGVTPAGICSLASGAQFTYIVSQSSVSDNLRKLLDDASNRDRKIPYRGRLLDLFGLQVLHIDSVLADESCPLRSIKISMVPTGQELPFLSADTLDRIEVEFQAKLLSFRCANLSAARTLRFDASNFTFALRDLARSIAAATPEDPDLQGEIFELLRDQDEEIRSGSWVELSTVVVESLLVGYYESPEEFMYIGDLTKFGQEILIRRGGDGLIDPGEFGKRLKRLGFKTEPRDARGIKIRLTEDVRRRAAELARDFGPRDGEKTASPESETEKA